MKCNRILLFALFAAILLSCGGCAAFRSMFDRKPPKDATEQAEEREARQERRQRERESAKVEDEPKKSGTLFMSSHLTAEEQAVLERSESASKRGVYDDEVEKIRRENRERSKSSSDSVFGRGLKDWL